MSLAKTGEIQNVCLPNALLTFKEYLLDYANEETKKIGEGLINAQIKTIENEKIRQTTIERLQLIEEGIRDLFF